MKEYGKINLILIAVLLAVILTLLIILLGTMDNGQNSPKPSENPAYTQGAGSGLGEELTILSVEDAGDMVLVTTNICKVKYPYPFADLVQPQVIQENGKIALRFCAVINNNNYPLYELVFGNQGTMPLGTLAVGTNSVAVTVNFFEAAGELSEDGRIAFVAAQETFNEAASSMSENTNFVPVG